MRCLILSLVLATMLGCANSTPTVIDVRESDHAYMAVSATELLGNCHQYHRWHLRVSGYLGLTFDGVGLFPASHDQISSDGVVINFSFLDENIDVYSRLGEPVVVDATFECARPAVQEPRIQRNDSGVITSIAVARDTSIGMLTDVVSLQIGRHWRANPP